MNTMSPSCEHRFFSPKSEFRNPKWGCLVTLLPCLGALLPLWAASAALADPPPCLPDSNGDGHPLFAHPQFVTGGTGAQFPASGDLDGDGHLDVAISSYGLGSPPGLSILMGLGGGLFADPVFYQFGTKDLDYPWRVALGDLDGDTDLDVVVLSQGSIGLSVGGVWVLLNDGTGSLSDAVFYEGIPVPWGLAVRDLDGDGDLDIATANNSSGLLGLSVFLNDGNGSLADPVSFQASPALGIALGDVDSDGAPDAVLVGNLGIVQVMRNDGQAVFSSISSTASAVGRSVAVEGFDGDGNLDVAVGHELLDTPAVHVHLGNGDGTFGPAVLYPAGRSQVWIAARDLNADGDIDLVTANQSDSTVSVLLGNGDGTFAPGFDYFVDWQNGSGSDIRSFVIDDMDEDGDLDIAAVKNTPEKLTVLLGHGDGTFANDVSTCAVGLSPQSIVTADLDGDGDLDFATANYRSDDVSIVLNNGDGSFAPQIAYETGGERLKDISASDVDADGDVDLVVVSAPETGQPPTPIGSAIVLNNNGDGTFAGPVSYAVGASPASVAAGDLNGDERPEITVVLGGGFAPRGVALDVASGKIYWGDAHRANIRRANLSDGSAIEDLVTNTGVFALALDLSAGKMYWTTNNDPDQILRANLDGSGVEVLANLEPGYADGIALDLATGKMYWTHRNAGIGKIQRANLDGSNIEDVITGLSSPAAVAVGPSAKVYWTQTGADARVRRANLDGTGVEDLVILGSGYPFGLALDEASGKMYWTDNQVDLVRRANLDGTSVEDLVGTGQAPLGLALDVVDDKMYWGDVTTHMIHRADLDGTNEECFIPDHDNVAVLLNNGDGTFAAPAWHTAGTQPSSVAVGDLNGDGDLDLVTANRDPDDITILFNNGDGTFPPGVSVEAAKDPLEVATADVDGDGDLDLVVGGGWIVLADGPAIRVLFNDGTGVFGGLTTYIGGTSVAVGDLDGDGDLDIASGRTVSGFSDAGVLFNNGHGVFAPMQRYASGSYIESVALGDFDSDGALDLAMAAEADDRAVILMNRACDACPGDLNEDGFRNMTDFTLFAQAYLSQLGDPDYNPDADFDGDGFVNMTDFTIFASYYGVPCP